MVSLIAAAKPLQVCIVWLLAVGTCTASDGTWAAEHAQHGVALATPEHGGDPAPRPAGALGGIAGSQRTGALASTAWMAGLGAAVKFDEVRQRRRQVAYLASAAGSTDEPLASTVGDSMYMGTNSSLLAGVVGDVGVQAASDDWASITNGINLALGMTNLWSAPWAAINYVMNLPWDWNNIRKCFEHGYYRFGERPYLRSASSYYCSSSTEGCPWRSDGPDGKSKQFVWYYHQEVKTVGGNKALFGIRMHGTADPKREFTEGEMRGGSPKPGSLKALTSIYDGWSVFEGGAGVLWDLSELKVFSASTVGKVTKFYGPVVATAAGAVTLGLDLNAIDCASERLYYSDSEVQQVFAKTWHNCNDRTCNPEAVYLWPKRTGKCGFCRRLVSWVTADFTGSAWPTFRCSRAVNGALGEWLGDYPGCTHQETETARCPGVPCNWCGGAGGDGLWAVRNIALSAIMDPRHTGGFPWSRGIGGPRKGNNCAGDVADFTKMARYQFSMQAGAARRCQAEVVVSTAVAFC